MDPEIIATLQRRSHIFRIVEALRAAGSEVSVVSITARMRAEPPGSFKDVDFQWVETMLAPRLSGERR